MQLKIEDLDLEELLSAYEKKSLPVETLLNTLLQLDDINVNLRGKVSSLSATLPFICRISPLTLALFLCNAVSYRVVMQTIQTLLDRGATTNALDIYLISQSEIYRLFKPLIGKLLEKFDVSTINDVLDKNDNTLLHKLAQAKHTMPSEVLTFLSKQNVNVYTKNSSDQLPLVIALESGKYTFVATFLHLVKEFKEDPSHIKHLYQRQGIFFEKAHEYLASLSPSDHQTIEAVDFEKAVSEFLVQHHFSSVADIFNPEKYPHGWCQFASEKYQKLLLKSFFSNPIITGYMTRNTIAFNKDSYPDYHPIEIEFYQRASEKPINIFHKAKPLFIPYRTQRKIDFYHGIEEDSPCNANPYKLFYALGASEKNIQRYLDAIKKSMPDLSNSYISLIFPRDSYELGNMITQLSQSLSLPRNIRGYAYVISATAKDAHIYATLSIINAQTKQIHCHMIFNSWLDNDYVAATYRQINYRQINEKTSEPSPLFDGCLSIQTNDGDNNCSQYTTRICRALYETFSTKDELQMVLENMNVSDTKDWEALRPYFHRCLKEKLSEFYLFNQETNDFEAKPYEELKQFHLKMRWEVGNQWIMNKQQKGTANICEDHEAWENMRKLFA